MLRVNAQKKRKLYILYLNNEHNSKLKKVNIFQTKKYKYFKTWQVKEKNVRYFMSVLLHCRLFEIAFDICYTVYVQYHYCLYSYILICWITIYLFSQLEYVENIEESIQINYIFILLTPQNILLPNVMIHNKPIETKVNWDWKFFYIKPKI